MAHYDYQCSKCGHALEDVYQSIKDKPLRKCPACKKLGLERIISGGIMATVKDVKTIGSLIDRNSKLHKNKIKEAECQKQEAEEKANPKPWYQQHRTLSNREVKKLNKRQLKKYVLEGKK